MRAVGYATTGEVDVLEELDLPIREPGAGEVRVLIMVSGVNPTDWKSRAGAVRTPIPPGRHQVPHLDGAGVVDAVGAEVDPGLLGRRVWLWLVAYLRLEGTAQEYAVIPASIVEPLPDDASFELGAALGVPFMTAHRALTLHQDGPRRLAPGVLAGQHVLVAGGAGAVGNAAIQLARWAGATVITTVSNAAKHQLATAAGAHHVINYREQDVVEEVRRISPAGVDTIVEVSPAANVDIDCAVLATNGIVAVYAVDGGGSFTLPVRALMTLNAGWHFLLLYTVTAQACRDAADAIGAALLDSAVRVGPEAGLPLHRFPLSDVAGAHRAVHGGAVGKVLVDVAAP
ncbi:MAG TPA: NADPH:quinone reductase [Pseudonocardiaceae bacterium]|jgi:NADPH2:quinone reductase|nr:NADPH:quinone reductase [Pseudonocardiaceae bacterium]